VESFYRMLVEFSQKIEAEQCTVKLSSVEERCDCRKDETVHRPEQKDSAVPAAKLEDSRGISEKLSTEILVNDLRAGRSKVGGRDIYGNTQEDVAYTTSKSNCPEIP
jgi:hypothetical protein